MLFFDESVHTIQGIKTIPLFFSVNENGVGELRCVPLHVQDVVGQENLFGILDVGKSEYSPAVHFIEIENFVHGFSIIFVGREGTQQLSVVLESWHTRMELNV